MMSRDLANLKRGQFFLKVLVFTFVTALIWVGFSLFQSQKKTGIDPELLKLAIPLNPNIDLDVIRRIEQKRQFSSSELEGFPILKVIKLRSGEESVTTQPIQQAENAALGQ